MEFLWHSTIWSSSRCVTHNTIFSSCLCNIYNGSGDTPMVKLACKLGLYSRVLSLLTSVSFQPTPNHGHAVSKKKRGKQDTRACPGSSTCHPPHAHLPLLHGVIYHSHCVLIFKRIKIITSQRTLIGRL